MKPYAIILLGCCILFGVGGLTMMISPFFNIFLETYTILPHSPTLLTLFRILFTWGIPIGCVFGFIMYVILHSSPSSEYE